MEKKTIIVCCCTYVCVRFQFVFFSIFLNSKEKLLGLQSGSGNKVSETFWLVLPINPDQVDRNTACRDEETHANLNGPHVKRQEDQECADEQKQDRNAQVHLDRPLHLWLLPPQVQQSRDGDQDEHGLHEGCVLNQGVDVASDQVHEGEQALSERDGSASERAKTVMDHLPRRPEPAWV